MRAYIDTSVFGGYYDREFQGATREFFVAVSKGRVKALLSGVLLRELEEAPEQVRELLRRVMLQDYEPLEVTEESIRLAEAYSKAGLIPEKYANDALHVALATLSRADVVISWNFRHMVNPAQQRAFNGVNIALGYGIISVMTPAEIVKVLEVPDETRED